MTPRRLLPLLIAVAALLAGCRSGQTGRTPAETGDPPATVASAVMRSDTLYRQWQTMRVPVRATIVSPAILPVRTVSGTATMVYGSLTRLSIRTFGMEVGVMEITPDGVLVLDKWNKKYLSVPATALGNDLPVTAADIQSLLLGRPFALGDTDALELAASPDGTGYTLASRKAYRGYRLAERFNTDGSLRAVTLTAPDGSGPVAECGLMVMHLGASTVHALAQLGPMELDMTLAWDFERARLDNPDDHIEPLTVPDGYSPMALPNR